MPHFICLFFSSLMLLAAPASAESCVSNGSAHSHLFAVTSPDSPRLVAMLAPGERLCSPTEQGAILSVYENSEAFEGCSRLVGTGKSDSLLAYAEFDRCRWGSHGVSNSR